MTAAITASVILGHLCKELMSWSWDAHTCWVTCSYHGQLTHMLPPCLSASRTPTMVLGSQGASTPTGFSCSSTQYGLQMRQTSSRDSSSSLTALLHTTVQEWWDLPMCYFTPVQWITVDNSAIPATVKEAFLVLFYHTGTYPVPQTNFISLWG